MARQVIARFSLLAAFAAVSSSVVVGCAVDAAPDDDETEASALTSAGKELIGAYTGESGGFRALVLTSDRVTPQRNKFIADVDTGIRCITTPCPSEARIVGTFTAGTKTITLRADDAPENVQKYLGRYAYVVQGEQLVLTKQGESHTLAKQESYCQEANDCWDQNIIVPSCMGSFTCSPQNTCSYSCGQWPPRDTRSDAVKCYSSASCAADEYCTTEDGVCNSSGMLAVCSGSCEKRAPRN